MTQQQKFSTLHSWLCCCPKSIPATRLSVWGCRNSLYPRRFLSTLETPLPGTLSRLYHCTLSPPPLAGEGAVSPTTRRRIANGFGDGPVPSNPTTSTITLPTSRFGAIPATSLTSSRTRKILSQLVFGTVSASTVHAKGGNTGPRNTSATLRTIHDTTRSHIGVAKVASSSG